MGILADLEILVKVLSALDPLLVTVEQLPSLPQSIHDDVVAVQQDLAKALSIVHGVGL